MKIVVFGDQQRVGAWVDDMVVDLAAADAAIPATLVGLIAAGERALHRVAAAIEAARTGYLSDALTPVKQTRLHAPAVHRPRIACAAGNYAAHTAGTARRKGIAATAALTGIANGGDVPAIEQIVEGARARNRPRGFWKDFALPTGPDDVI